MKVDEQTFINQYMPLSLLALTVHAMYYGEGAYADGKLTTKAIAAQFELEPEGVWRLLDIADSMLAIGARDRKLRL